MANNVKGFNKQLVPAPVGFHFQEPVFGWQQAIQRQRPGTVNKFFHVQMCSEAKALRPDCYTVLRHHMSEGDQNKYLAMADRSEAARQIYRRFIDGTFAEHAANVDAVEFTNETWGPDPNRRAQAQALDIAGAKVWREEYANQARYSHIRVIIANAAVGNNPTVEVGRAIQRYRAICGYHPYIPVKAGKELIGSEGDYSLRWMAIDDIWRSQGVTVDWFFGEIGLVGYQGGLNGLRFEPGWGWQHPDVANGDLGIYLNILDRWAGMVMWWNAKSGNRAFGGTIFSSGPGWPYFQVRQPALNSVAEHYKNFQPVNPPPPPPPPPPPKEKVLGVDVSHWQGGINWAKVASTGVRFAFIKCGEGTAWIDDRFTVNWHGSKAVGILRGAYHYYKSGLDPIQQAKFFASILPTDSELPPVVDVEDTKNIPAGLADRLLQYLRELERLTGRRPIIYTGAWFWDPYIGNVAWAKEYDLWVADYSGPVDLPKGWTAWKFQQFTSSGNGPDYGVSSSTLDLNWFAGSMEELAQYAKAPGNPPAPPPAQVDMAFWKIGWHAGVGGNRSGIGDYMKKLDEAGIPFCVKSVQDAGLAVEAAQYARQSGVEHNIILRIPEPAGRPNDLPNFSLSPQDAAREHWAVIKGAIAPEILQYKDLIWIEPTNEIDTHTKADWLGWFMFYSAVYMMEDGFKALLSGFNAGQPEKEHWELIGMRRFLELCAEYPDKVAVSMHAGKTNAGKNDPIEDFFPHMIGRWLWLFEACDEMGIGRPNVYISEWAWGYRDMPEPGRAMEELAWLAEKMAPYPTVRGAFLWCLNGGNEWGNLPDLLNRLMTPVTEKTLSERIQVGEAPPPPPPVEPPPPPPTDGKNLLVNGSFEGTWFHPNGIPELQIPEKWAFTFKGEETPNPHDSNPWSKFRRPEVRVLSKDFLPEREWETFIFDGNQTVKIFKGSGSIWAGLSQEVQSPAGRYELTIRVFADLVKGYTQGGDKIWADDPDGRDGLIRISFGNQALTDWITLRPGQRNTIGVAFSPEGPGVLDVEFMCPFALANNGLFVDAWELIAVEETPPPPPPPLPPEQPPNELFDETLRRLAAEHQVIHFNETAALQRKMVLDGFVPMSEEFSFLSGGVKAIAQSAYHLAGHPERIYWCEDGQWQNVNWMLLIESVG